MQAIKQQQVKGASSDSSRNLYQELVRTSEHHDMRVESHVLVFLLSLGDENKCVKKSDSAKGFNTGEREMGSRG